jgi:multiple sugar transport system permease protein
MSDDARPDTMLAEREDRVFAYCTLLPAALLFLLLVVVPAITVVLMSLQDVSIGSTSGPFVGLENFIWAFTSPKFFTVLANTLIWVFGSVALEMLLGLGVALLLNKNFVGRGVARAIVFAPYIVPTVVAVLVWQFMFHDILGILNHGLTSAGLVSQPVQWLASPETAMLSVIIVAVWKLYPFVVLALLGILQSIPQEQYEAATVDGASAFQQFWRITLPYVMPVFLLTALLRTIWAFHKFDIIYMLTGGGPLGSTTTLPVLVYQKAFDDFEMGRGAAVALITAAIIAVLSGLYALMIRWAERRQ